MNLTPWTQPHEPTRVLCPWDSPGKNTGVGYHFLLQDVFPSQGWNLGLLHHRQILYHLSHYDSWDAPQSAVCELENQGSPWHASIRVQSPERQWDAGLSLGVWRSVSRCCRALACPWPSSSRRGTELPSPHLSAPLEGLLDRWGWLFMLSTRSNANHFQAHTHRLARKECFQLSGHPSLRAVTATVTRVRLYFSLLVISVSCLYVHKCGMFVVIWEKTHGSEAWICTVLSFPLKKGTSHQLHVRRGRVGAWLCSQTCDMSPSGGDGVPAVHTLLLQACSYLLKSAEFLLTSKVVYGDKVAYRLTSQSLRDSTSAVFLLKYAPFTCKSFKQYTCQ